MTPVTKTHTKIANPQKYHDKLDKGIYVYMKKKVTSCLVVWLMIVVTITNGINLFHFPDCDCSRLFCPLNGEAKGFRVWPHIGISW